MTYPIAEIDYQKCRPHKCGNGICTAVMECPNKVLRQEDPYDFPFSHPSHFCKGCAKCVDACPFKAIRIE